MNALPKLLLLALCALPALALGDQKGRISLMGAQSDSVPELEVNSLRVFFASDSLASLGLEFQKLSLEDEQGERKQFNGLGILFDAGNIDIDTWIRFAFGITVYHVDADNGLGAGAFTEFGPQLPLGQSFGLWASIRADLIYHEQSNTIGSNAVGFNWSW